MKIQEVHSSIIGGIQSIITPKDVARNATYFEARLTDRLGYGTNNLDNFIDLDNHMAKYQLFRCIEVIPGSLYPFRCKWIDSSGERYYYEYCQFFLLADMIRKGGEVEPEKPKETIARPFTIDEFNERFKLGSPVHFAEKDGGYERYAMYTGYCIDKSEAWVSLGRNAYKLNDLFDNYKLAIGYVKKDGREEPIWGVFGVDSGVYKYEE